MNDSNVTAGAIWPWNIEYLSAICSTLPVSTSLLNFAMNSIIIVIIVTQIRNTPRRRPHPCNIHLIFLAISDISIGVSFVGGALWLHLIDLQRVVDLRFVFYFIIFATFVNRTLTLYITFTRTWCLFHSQVAVVDTSRAQPTNYTIAHFFKWAISPGVVMFLLSKFIPDFFVDRQIIERRSADLILFGMIGGKISLTKPKLKKMEEGLVNPH